MYCILFHDETGREILCPVDSEEQPSNYSGKKKKYTLKNAVVITTCYLILFVSESVCAKMHDKKLHPINYDMGLFPIQVNGLKSWIFIIALT